MKKLLLLSFCFIAFINSIWAQVPGAFNYQGVARNGSGAALANQAIGLRISVLNTTNTVLYAETHAATTNTYGLYNVLIGSGTVVTGSFSSVDWLDGERFVKVEIDPAGGTAYVAAGTPTKLVSVPYAMAANSVQATSGGGKGMVGSATSSLWWGFYEGGVYRGYLGSYSGKNEDVDFGTGGGNTLGSVHLTIGASPKFTVDSIGNVGVGTRFPRYRLQVDGITGTFNDNGIRIQNTTANTGWSFYASSSGEMIIGKTSNLGTFNATTGAYTSLSDARLKTNIQSIGSVLPKLKTLDAKRYEFKYNNPEHIQSIGFLAQDVQAVFPELVTANKNNEGNPIVENQLSMDYSGLSVLAIKAIQEQQVLIEELRKEIEVLKTKIK
ncbi:hypothetical protein DBR32_08690 [Taibaiella sp. KBW10]|uniref:tail fiber domain-containing protein n=1 Tax=Taibaiella sp. KBW10 TaxID=2153357 RepID=UPI000F594D3D|nr:tail fiber domain-containing protein [Taibaiella sp. KBW10]RQO30790.1 hypothetical protein DBR32_08690 [Taibaiella sp. KBW10]